MNNDWYSKGQNPPVGEVCILASVGFTELNHEVEITYVGDGVGCYRWLKNNQEYTVNLGDAMFRPFRTETDKLVEQAMKSFDKAKYTSGDWRFVENAVEQLVDAGYRKVKPMTEDEFVAAMWAECYMVKNTAKRLYRAGCRFLDTSND